MSSQIDYQVLLETIVMTAKDAAESAKERRDEAMLFAYYDILDAVKTQADIMQVPLEKIGLKDVDLDELVKATVDIAKQKQVA